MDEIKEKQCKICLLYFPLSREYFYKGSCTGGVSTYCKKCENELSTIWYKTHKERVIRVRARHRDKNRDDYNRTHREYAKANPNRPATQKKWRENNKDKNNESVKMAKKKRYHNDTEYKTLLCLKGTLNYYLKRVGVKKTLTHIDLLGCSSSFFINYIETQFEEGMTWANRGRGDGMWQIDHIRPCASFNIKDIEEQKICFHYTNLRPLWANDNLAKGSLYNGVHIRKKKVS